MDLVLAIVLIVVGIVVGIALGFAFGIAYRKKVAEREIGSAEAEATRLINEALRSGESRELLRAKTVKPPSDDIRCDLHARFVFGGSHISFDTVQNGRREVALIPIDALNF